jgi:hypothetical protein
MTTNEAILRIRELDLDMISPCVIPNRWNTGTKNGTKLVVIGRPNTGKSYLLKSLIYNKHRAIPAGMVFCGTENVTDPKDRYRNFIPDTFIYTQFEPERVVDFIKRQKIACKHLPNPWAFLLIDDCTDDPKILNTPLFQNIFKNGRHWKMFFILSLQYSMDIRPGIRQQIDGTFILRESNLKSRRVLYENFAGMIPDFTTFCDIMDQLTGDYTALYIDNFSQSNQWEDNIYWYKAKPIPPSFRFGNKDYWKFHESRYDPNYEEIF